MYLYDYLFNYLFVCLFIYVFIYQWQPLLEQISIQTSAFLKKGQFFINPPQENSLHSPYLNISLFPSPKPGGEEGSWVMGQWENPSHIPKESTKPIKKKNLNEPRADLSQSCLTFWVLWRIWARKGIRAGMYHWNSQGTEWNLDFIPQSAEGTANFSLREVTKKGTCNLSSLLTSALGQAWPRDLILNLSLSCSASKSASEREMWGIQMYKSILQPLA